MVFSINGSVLVLFQISMRQGPVGRQQKCLADGRHAGVAPRERLLRRQLHWSAQAVKGSWVYSRLNSFCSPVSNLNRAARLAPATVRAAPLNATQHMINHSSIFNPQLPEHHNGLIHRPRTVKTRTYPFTLTNLLRLNQTIKALTANNGIGDCVLKIHDGRNIGQRQP